VVVFVPPDQAKRGEASVRRFDDPMQIRPARTFA
jgi:hypothetical protein